MLKIKKSGEILLGLLLMAIAVFVLMPIKAEAKSAADAAAAYDGVDTSVLEGVNTLAVTKPGITLDGYDLTNYSVLINANNVTVKNCTNIKFVNILPNLSGVKVTGCTIVGPYATGVSILSDKVEISNNTITGTTNFGIYAENRKECNISGNTISGNSGLYSMIIKNCSNMTISGNTIKDSALDGLRVEGDTGSVISKNKILNSAAAGWTSSGHGEGLIISVKCNGTQVIENTIDGVKTGKTDYGNGIIIADSTNITVKGNIVTNAGNHGIQASYGAKSVVFDGNTVTKSGNDGISVSRGTNADCTNNKIHDNIGNGIVYDGNAGANTGTIKGNDIYSNTEFGVYLSVGDFNVADNKIGNNGFEGIRANGNAGATTGTISGNTLYDNASTVGMQFFTGTTFKASNNHIYKSTIDKDGYGIQVNSGANVEVTGNRVCNYGTCAIFASETSTFKASNNQATLSDLLFKGNAYIKANDLFQNTLIAEIIGGDTYVGQTYFEGYKSGVVIKGKVYLTTSDNKGKINVTYPLVDSINDVIPFTVDNNGNSIVLNADKDFILNLDGAQGTNNGNEEQVKEFVKRFYVTILQRPYDDKGLSDWASVLLSKKMSASDVAYGFVFSDEFKDKGYSNEEFVARLYSAFFNREAANDPDGASLWVNSLYGGKSREYVFAGFVGSAEFKNLCAAYGMDPGSYSPSGEPSNPAPNPQPQPQPQPQPSPSGIRIDASGVDPAKLDEFMERLYNEALGRPSDPQGKQDWANAILSGQYDAGTVARYGFFASQEYIEKNKSPEEFVHDAYRAFFGRNEDQSGFDMWVNGLKDGTYTRDQVIEKGFGYSDEFINLLESYGFKVYR